MIKILKRNLIKYSRESGGYIQLCTIKEKYIPSPVGQICNYSRETYLRGGI